MGTEKITASWLSITSMIFFLSSLPSRVQPMCLPWDMALVQAVQPVQSRMWKSRRLIMVTSAPAASQTVRASFSRISLLPFFRPAVMPITLNAIACFSFVFCV